MQIGGTTAPGGRLGLVRLRAWPMNPNVRAILRHGLPRPGLPLEVALWRARNLPNLARGFWKLALARLFGLPHFCGVVYFDRLYPDGRRVQLGLASLRVVTDAGVAAIVDAFQNAVELENFKFHGFGTGTNNEAAGDTALQTELTTQYATDNTRPTGSQTENGANVYRTVATLDPDADVAITEHGVFTQAATGGGTLLDRSKFAAVNLVGATGDALQATYDFTINSGG
jgi:hypothetical protein